MSLNLSAHSDENSTWPAIETSYPFEIYLNDAVCEIFNSGRWDELKRTVFLTVKYHNPKNLIFQHIPIREKVKYSYKNRLQEMNHCRNGVIFDTLISQDIIQVVICGGVLLEVYEGFFWHNMQHIPYTEFVKDMVSKRDLYKKQGKNLLKTLAKKITNSMYGGKIRQDVNDQFRCVTEDWMRHNYDCRAKEWWPMKSGFLIDKLEDDVGVDDQVIAKSSN